MEFSADIIAKLPKLEIFSDFTEHTEDNERILKKICLALEVRDFSKGEVIINEGDLGDTLYILHTGSVQVKRNTPGNEQFVRCRPALGLPCNISDCPPSCFFTQKVK